MLIDLFFCSAGVTDENKLCDLELICWCTRLCDRKFRDYCFIQSLHNLREEYSRLVFLKVFVGKMVLKYVSEFVNDSRVSHEAPTTRLCVKVTSYHSGFQALSLFCPRILLNVSLRLEERWYGLEWFIVSSCEGVIGRGLREPGLYRETRLKGTGRQEGVSENV